MAQPITDEEQLELLKNWWKNNSRSLLLAVGVALAAYFGWQWWTKFQQDYAEQAAAIYRDLAESVAINQGETLSEDNYATAKFLIEQLQTDYNRTLYALNASLLGAKLAVDKGDLSTAEQQLTLALEYSDQDTRPLVSLRLAKVYFAQENYDQALAVAAYDIEDSFTGLFAALRGDILVAKGDIEAARADYQLALESLSNDSTFQRRMVEIKLSDLGDGHPH